MGVVMGLLKRWGLQPVTLFRACVLPEVDVRLARQRLRGGRCRHPRRFHQGIVM